MAKYKSTPAIVERPAKEVFDRLSNLSLLQDQLDQLPEEQRAALGKVEFTPEGLRISTDQVGDILFVTKEKEEPTRIVFGTEASPIPLTMEVDITPMGQEQSEVAAVIDVDIPIFARPLVGPVMQKAADHFGELIRNLNA